MIDIEQTVKEVSKETGIDKEIVDTVLKHVFKETVKAMKDKEEVLDILFNGLMKFKLKGRFKDNKTKNYSPNEIHN